jgi:hypothetical protein
MLDPNNAEDLKSFEKCRQINSEIINFGVNDKEIKKIIELLSYELEDTNLMKEINIVLKNKKVSEENLEKPKLILQ